MIKLQSRFESLLSIIRELLLRKITNRAVKINLPNESKAQRMLINRTKREGKRSFTHKTYN